MDGTQGVTLLSEADYRRTCSEPMENIAPAPAALALGLDCAKDFFAERGVAAYQVRFELGARSEECQHLFFSCDAMADFVVIVLDRHGGSAIGLFPFHFREAFGTQAELARLVTAVLRNGAGPDPEADPAARA